MKKVLLGLFALVAVFATAFTTNVYAASSHSLEKDGDRYYLTQNGNRIALIEQNYYIYLDLESEGLSDLVGFTLNFQRPDASYLAASYQYDGQWGVISEIEMEIYESTTVQGGYDVEISIFNPTQQYGEHFEVSDSTTQIYLTNIIQIPDSRLAINGQENFATSVDDARPVSFFQSYLTAWDETDGDLTDDIYIISDNYTPNVHTLGHYAVTFGVQDNAGNEATLQVYIHVVDITSPVITGNASVVEISYTQTYNYQNFRTTLSVNDNYDDLDNDDIYILENEYAGNETTLGTYNITYAASDASENVGTFVKTVVVIDDVAPTISGPTVLTKPTTSVLTISQILSQLSAYDEKEGNVTSSLTVISDAYTGNANRVGSYNIMFEASDSSGNTTTHLLTVTVTDNIPPVWYIRDGVSIVLQQPQSIDLAQIRQILITTHQLTITSTTQTTWLVDNYTDNEETPGVYTMALGWSNLQGDEGVINFAITVVEATEVDITEPVHVPWYQHVWNFIAGIFSWIWNLISSFFNWLGSLFGSSESAFKIIRFKHLN